MHPYPETIKCPYQPGDDLKNSPHHHQPFRAHPKKVYDDVLDAVGNTPMIRINKIGKEQGIDCQLFAKCQFLNPSGSLKDRVGKRMILDGIASGKIKEGTKIVEGTSGNTGIMVALACAIKGLDCTITMPEKMSVEKGDVQKILGAKVIRTPNGVPIDSPLSHVGVAKQLQAEGAVFLDQYKNPSNPVAHYDQMAEEILDQLDGDVDAIVMGAGTGGVITGIARKFKDKSPKTLIIGSDPDGSIMASPHEINGPIHSYQMEGIGHDYVPRTLSRQQIDEWRKTTDRESYHYARKLIGREGLLVGGSAGAVMQATIDFIKAKGWEKDSTKKVVLIFADSIRNYLTKFVSNQWMVEKGLMPYETLTQPGHPLNQRKIEDLNLLKVDAFEDLTVKDAQKLFSEGYKLIPLRAGNTINAVVTPRRFLSAVAAKKLTAEDSALKTKTNDFPKVPDTLDAGQLSTLLERYEHVLIERRSADGQKIEGLWVATASDVVKLLA